MCDELDYNKAFSEWKKYTVNFEFQYVNVWFFEIVIVVIFVADKCVGQTLKRETRVK